MLTVKQEILLDRLCQYFIQCKRLCYRDIIDHDNTEEILSYISAKEPTTVKSEIDNTNTSDVAIVDINGAADSCKDNLTKYINDMCNIGKLFKQHFNVTTSTKDNKTVITLVKNS